MRITIFGAGYVGLVTGACLSSLGNTVTCVDVNSARIAALNRGEIPIYEPGLGELVHKNVAEKRLFFTEAAAGAIASAEIAFICVGTPRGNAGEADLSYVFSVAKTIGQHMKQYLVVVDKSTVPVGTADKVAAVIKEHQPSPVPFSVVSNPEFLREGEAIKDFMTPDRIVVGAGDDKAKEIMTRLYKGIARTGKPIVITDVKSAELTKYAANALLATKISFMNEVARLCEKTGADVKQIAHAIGLDTRIGPRFLQAGIGYGGSCFPKDVQALIHTAREMGSGFSILEAVHAVNETQKKTVFAKIEKALGSVAGKKIALLGLSFKPKTDDIREAPSKVLIQQLLDAGAHVQVFDPAAMDAMRSVYPQIQYCADAYSTIIGADCFVLVTEWDEFRFLDFSRIKETMQSPIVIDARNMYDPVDMRTLGFTYVGVGRP